MQMDRVRKSNDAHVIETTNSAVTQAYLWMATGLIVTGLVAAYTSKSPMAMTVLFANKINFILMSMGEIALVAYLVTRLQSLTAAKARGLFLAFSVLNGMMCSTVFLAYTRFDISRAFLVAALMFGVMSAYGNFTRRDLTSWGSFLTLGLFGILIASVANFLLHSPVVQWVACCCGVIVFSGLAAYDTQKIKRMVFEAADDETLNKISIRGALMIYLDMINLFLVLLELTAGKRR